MKKGKKMKHELSDINPQKMDSQKWDMLLDLLEHPEKYSETQKDELLGDEEVNELYQQLIETRQTLDFAKSKEKMKMPSIDAEWEKLKDEMKLKEEKQQKEEMSQNAETQQTAKLFPLWSPMRKVAAVAAVLVVSGITFAAIHLVTRSHQASYKNNTELVASQKDELLGDEEVNELYQQLVETRQSLDFAKSKEKMKMPSIDAEWEKLKDEMKLKEEKQQKEEMNQNAETQQTAKLFPLWSPMRKVAAVAAVLVVSGITFAAIHLVTRSHQPSDKNNTELVSSRKNSIQQVSAPQKSNIEEKTDSASLAQLPLVYENAELQNILTPIAGHFHLQVTYQNESARHIRLFLQLEKNMSLDDIIELMNHFEKVNIRHEGQTLIVE